MHRKLGESLTFRARVCPEVRWGVSLFSGMSPFQIVASSATIIGLIITVSLLFREHKLFWRPRVRLAFGLVNDSALKRRERRKTRSTLVLGLNCNGLSHVIVPCVYRLHNDSPLPVTQIAIRLDYPAECLADDTVVINSLKQVATLLRSIVMSNRTVSRIGNTASVEYTISILRPGDCDRRFNPIADRTHRWF
jgi:hypothetical protein